MIDGIKLSFVANEDEIKEIIERLQFTGFYTLNAGSVDIKTRKFVAKNQCLDIVIYDSRTVIIQGSLHKYYHNGNNSNDFTLSDVRKAIIRLSNEIGIEPIQMKVQRIEVGVNIRSPTISFGTIEDNLIHHKLHLFKAYEKGNQTFGYSCKHQRFELKIYDKSIQINDTAKILRLEYKTIKMEHIKKCKISTLYDLVDTQKLQSLIAIMCKSFEEIQMDNYETMNQLIKEKRIPIDDAIFYLQARNIKHWLALKKAKNYNKTSSDRRRFNRILNKYSLQNMTEQLIEIIQNKFQELINN